jgi:hypothetical protein
MNIEHREMRAEASEPSVWRLGDVLNELLGKYGLAEANRLPQGQAAVCGEAGLFAAVELPAVTASTY